MANYRTYNDDELLPISALQHFVFCRRQCALIHIEQAWQENRLTAEGRIMHEHVHDAGAEQRGLVRIARGLHVRSLRLGLVGVTDVVEFHRQADGTEVAFPIEYKRGKPKKDACDHVQLCAQALCLEEMLGIAIGQGAIFYGQPRRRQPVEFSLELRVETERTAEALHDLIRSERTPPPEYDKKKCNACSLVEVCMPKTRYGVDAYLRWVLE